MDNRAAHFLKWLEQVGGVCYLDQLQSLTEPQVIGIVAAYLRHVAETPHNSKGDLPMADTLAHYANAAIYLLRRVVHHPFSAHLPNTKQPTFVPFIRDIIDQRRKWQQPRPRREAFTISMFKEFHLQVTSRAKANVGSHLTRHALIFDCARLGCFTGARSAEYSQNKARKGDFARIPDSFAASNQRGKPIAYIQEDFIYLDEAGHIIPHAQCFSAPSRPAQLQLTTRYDKSGRNFSVRKFGRGQGFLCPISASISILYRAHLLGAGPMEPVTVHKDTSTPKGYSYLRADDFTKQMRQIVVDAYPDPQHFLRINITRFVAHSNRVTAAISLCHMGMDIDAIAHRLRWQPNSVKTYLRESNHDIGDLTKAAIGGAVLNY